MSRPVIRIENLGKQYYLGREAYRHQTLRGAISEFARSPLRRLRHLAERGRQRGVLGGAESGV